MGGSVLEPIPKEKKGYRGIDIFLIWAGGNTCLATIFTGGLVLGLVAIIDAREAYQLWY